MNFRLNLADQPFRNRALPWTAAILVSLISLVLLVFILAKNSEVNRQNQQLMVEVAAQRQDVNARQARAQEVVNALTPVQRVELSATRTLVDRKEFSWTRLLNDLEGILPGGVSVAQIKVRGVSSLGGRTAADLDLVVVGRSIATVTDMVAQMNRGGAFQAEVVSQELLKDKNQSGTQWTLRVLYRPGGGTSVVTGQAATATRREVMPAEDLSVQNRTTEQTGTRRE